jgi:hypothetical protein
MSAHLKASPVQLSLRETAPVPRWGADTGIVKPASAVRSALLILAKVRAFDLVPGFPLSGTSRRLEVLVFFPALPIFLPSPFKSDPEIFNPVRN